MVNQKLVINLASLTAILLTYTLSANAQSSRTFVSAQKGSDANASSNCSATAPCRTFAAAIGVTNAAGEIVVQDSGGYGPFTIPKAIRIEAAPGVYAGITVQDPQNAITVAATATDEVVLKGLTIHEIGSSTVSSGILVSNAEQVHIEGCAINGCATGVLVQTMFTCNVFVQDSVIRNCGTGIWVAPAPGQSIISVNHTRLEANSTALATKDFAKTAVRDSVVAGNTLGLVSSCNTVSGAAELNVEDSDIFANNMIGLNVIATGSGCTAIARASGTLITGNMNGISTSAPGGTVSVVSYGNNRLSGNGADGSFTSNVGLH